MIRSYRPADLDAIQHITVICFDGVSIDRNIEEHFGRIGGHDWRWRKNRHIDDDVANGPGRHVFVAEVAGEVAGYISVRIHKESRIGLIPNLAVDPRHQGAGIGRCLIAHALEFMARQGMECARIETLEQNPIGSHLYPSAGFVEVARQIHYAARLPGWESSAPESAPAQAPPVPADTTGTVSQPGFLTHSLDEGHTLLAGRLPDRLIPDEPGFEALWNLHPNEYHEIKMHGRLVKTPRWQQAYGKDYRYTGRLNRAMPVPDLLGSYLTWARDTIHPRLNGLLLNWYDGRRGHYIGRHRDSPAGMIRDTPIVTMSLGEERTFRLRPWRGDGKVDFPVTHGTVMVMPYATNQFYTHEVPASKRLTGRRISITLRAFV